MCSDIQSTRRPNVVLLYTDQQRWDALRCAGNQHIHTPNLDALADDGALFTHSYCNSPVCMPSRQSMLSGQYPSSVGTTCNGVEMPEDMLTIQKVLGRGGYHTANLGKLHFLNHSDRDHREAHPDYGFDELLISDEPGCYDDAYIKWVQEKDPEQVDNCRCTSPPAVTEDRIEKQPRAPHQPYVFDGPEQLSHTAFVAEETARYIHQRAAMGPFFVIGGFYAPHAPLNPPRRFVDMYDPEELPPPAALEGQDRFDLSTAEWQRIKAFYYALVSHVDDQVGRVIQALEDTGQRDDTLVIFTSDHGEHLGDHGRVAKGPPGYDSCARVPLIMSYPNGFDCGQKREELIEAVDIVPTILDYCGFQIPPIMQGRSFRSLLDGSSYEERTSAFLELKFPFKRSWKTIRTRQFKYCTNRSGQELLFDLNEDPNELHDVSDNIEYVEALHECRRELLRRWFDVQQEYPLRSAQY